MSILIKGMEMPKNCEKCNLCDVVYCNSYRFCSLDFYRETRAPDCPLIEVPSHEFARCTCEDSVQENGITLISEWATKGIDLAGEYGKTIDDLIVFLRVSYGMRIIFDLIGKQPKDVSDEHTD